MCKVISVSIVSYGLECRHQCRRLALKNRSDGFFFSLSRLLFGLFGEMPIPLLSHTKVNWKLCLHQNKQNAIDFIPSRRERAIRNSNNLIDFLICIFKDEVEQRKKTV